MVNFPVKGVVVGCFLKGGDITRLRTSSNRPPGRPKQSERLAIPDTILRIASRLFMDYGYDAVSLEAIAEAAKITKASIYYYFPTKSDVFVAAVERLLSTICRQTQTILDGPRPLKDRLLELTETRLRIAETRFDFERVVSEAAPQLSPEQLLRIRQAMQNLADVLIQAFRQAEERGDLAVQNPVFTAHAYMAILNAAFARTPAGERLFADPHATAQEIVTLIMSGLEPR